MRTSTAAGPKVAPGSSKRGVMPTPRRHQEGYQGGDEQWERIAGVVIRRRRRPMEKEEADQEAEGREPLSGDRETTSVVALRRKFPSSSRPQPGGRPPRPCRRRIVATVRTRSRTTAGIEKVMARTYDQAAGRERSIAAATQRSPLRRGGRGSSGLRTGRRHGRGKEREAIEDPENGDLSRSAGRRGRRCPKRCPGLDRDHGNHAEAISSSVAIRGGFAARAAGKKPGKATTPTVIVKQSRHVSERPARDQGKVGALHRTSSSRRARPTEAERRASPEAAPSPWDQEREPPRSSASARASCPRCRTPGAASGGARRAASGRGSSGARPVAVVMSLKRHRHRGDDPNREPGRRSLTIGSSRT